MLCYNCCQTCKGFLFGVEPTGRTSWLAEQTTAEASCVHRPCTHNSLHLAMRCCPRHMGSSLNQGPFLGPQYTPYIKKGLQKGPYFRELPTCLFFLGAATLKQREVFSHLLPNRDFGLLTSCIPVCCKRPQNPFHPLSHNNTNLSIMLQRPLQTA